MASICSATSVRPVFRVQAPGRPRPQPRRVAVRGAGDDSAPAEKGVIWGPAARWPPQPITEHGEPREEDDPKNWKGVGVNRKYVGKGDPAAVQKKLRENSPFSKGDREAGTQVGGGGEGSAA